MQSSVHVRFLLFHVQVPVMHSWLHGNKTAYKWNSNSIMYLAITARNPNDTMRLLIALLTLTLGVLSSAVAAKKAPIKYIDDFNFRSTTSNQLNCPAAHESTFTGPLGGRWGILCGWYDQTFCNIVNECLNY